MDTEGYYLIENTNVDIDKIQDFIQYGDDHYVIKEYIEIVRHIQEIEQLFQIYRWNLNNLMEKVEMNYGGTFSYKHKVDAEDLIPINAMTINLISAGNTLAESIKTFLELHFSKEEVKKIRQELDSREYDKEDSYKLITEMRNFVQHCHLLVSVYENNGNKRICFDLDQIFHTPHFNKKEKFASHLAEIKNLIELNFNDNPRLDYAETMSRYNLSLHRIYKNFFKKIRNYFQQIDRSTKEYLMNNPEKIVNCSSNLDGQFVYCEDDGFLHIFFTDNGYSKMFDSFENHAGKLFSKEEKLFKKQHKEPMYKKKVTIDRKESAEK